MVSHIHACDRVLVVDGDGRLVSCCDGYSVTADQLFAVVVVWDPTDPTGWRGTLTTLDHRPVRFAHAELDDQAFQRWLRDLPGWDPGKLSHALIWPGLHLVWRRPGA
jgi:hypothetical protein